MKLRGDALKHREDAVKREDAVEHRGDAVMEDGRKHVLAGF